MRIKLKKKAEEYKPVKGNEEEIINHLLNHYGECYVEKNNETVSFHIPHKTFFINDETTFFKCGKDGEIHTAKDKYNFKNYVAVPFSIASQDMVKILRAQNFVSLDMESDSTIDTLLKKWKLKTTTKTFTITQNDILIFNRDWKIVDCLMNEQNKQYENLLACNDYIVERED